MNSSGLPGTFLLWNWTRGANRGFFQRLCPGRLRADFIKAVGDRLRPNRDLRPSDVAHPVARPASLSAVRHRCADCTRCQDIGERLYFALKLQPWNFPLAHMPQQEPPGLNAAQREAGGASSWRQR
jgi:hypothetical protein